MRVLDYQALRSEKGIKYSKPQLWRRVKAKTFPKPIKLGNKNAWVEKEVDAWLADRVAERDGK